MSVINWNKCKEFLLEYSEHTRPEVYQHSRVSKSDILPMLENELRDAMRKLVKAQPSIGVTIKRP